MKKIEEKAVAFAKSIWEDYLVNRDLLKLTTVFDDNASYIGTGDGEICYSLEQVRAALLGVRPTRPCTRARKTVKTAMYSPDKWQ